MQKTFLNKEIFLSGVIALFAIMFLWGFRSHGIYSLGFNATFFGCLIFLLFIVKVDDSIADKKEFFKKNLYWMIPLFLINMSFSIYENSSLKIINFLFLPVAAVFFFHLSFAKFEGKNTWNVSVIKKLLLKKISLKKAFLYIIAVLSGGDKTKAMYTKIGLGILLFIVVDSVIIALLMGADEHFASLVSGMVDILSVETFMRCVMGGIIFIVLLGFYLSWGEENIIKNDVPEKDIDAVISGIVLGGTLVTYILFIGVQINTIFINTLPSDMNTLVELVKNGFWELFFVSVINIIFFFVYYKKTLAFVQKILFVFVIASSILVFSAGMKMFLYVSSYGLSYEKFFASYTVIYFGILFVVMLGILLFKRRVDILKIASVLALWMYAFINILPTESFIFHVNTMISLNPNTHIQRYQSHILSIDILPSVLELKGSDLYVQQDWEAWIYERNKEVRNKKWYEKNLHNFMH